MTTNTMELRELPATTSRGHVGERTHRSHELYVNGTLVRTFRENSQLDGYATGRTYDALVHREVETLEKALGCRCNQVSRRHWTPQLKAQVFDMMYGDIESFEWSGTRRGQGSGPMSSGGDGPKFAACPVCHGLKEPNGHFTAEAVGHKKGCALKELLDKAEKLS